jgi:hypothetical protein
VRSAEPDARDFLSHKELGRKPPKEPAEFYLWDGVSVYDDAAAARATAEYYWPRLGEYLATLEVPADASLRYQETGKHPHHCTLWGMPEAMVARIVSVEAIRRVSR